MLMLTTYILRGVKVRQRGHCPLSRTPASHEFALNATVLRHMQPLTLQMRREFQMITGVDDAKSLKDEWCEWMQKIIEVAKVESTSRPAIRQLLLDLESVDSDQNGII